MDDTALLRKRVGESIPAGGTEADTLFTDVEIDDILDRNGGVTRTCMREAWEMKAAALATLVTTAEGSSIRKLSDAFEHAQKMLTAYGGPSGGSRTVISRINRSGPWRSPWTQPQ
jgi:hypothetical protein